MGPDVPNVAGSGLLVYITLGVALLAAVATLIRQGAIPVLSAWSEFAAQRRTAAAARAATDYSALEAKLQNVASLLAEANVELAAIRSQMNAWEDRAIEHSAWDLEARRQAIAHGYELADPPPLFPEH